MYDKEDMKKAALRYFEGNATEEEGKRLLDFISSAEGRKLFDAWEEEWACCHIPSDDTLNQWTALQEKVRTEGCEMSMYEHRPHTFRMFRSMRRPLLYLGAAAVIAVTVMVAVVALNRTDTAVRMEVCSVPDGSTTKMTLADGTRVWLNGGSRLAYPVDLEDGARKVKLSGEAYFEVKKIGGRPFVVSTGSYDIAVRGTRFNVSAYYDAATVTTTLYEGMVDIVRGDTVMSMKPGDEAVFDKQKGGFSRRLSGTASPLWTKGDVVCENVTVAQFAKTFSRRYGVKMRVADPEVGRMKISVILQNGETIDDVVSAIERITEHKVKRTGNNYLIE